MTLRTQTVLDGLVDGVKQDMAGDRGRRPLVELRSRCADMPETLDFENAIAKPAESEDGLIKVIAEVKRASPSQGAIAEEADPVDVARRYAEGGAAAISVLTERRKFRGSIDDLRATRSAVSLPVMRKEFIFDPYQVFEAREAGADAILLIAAILEPSALEDLRCQAEELGMVALVEIYDEEEVERTLRSGSRIVGVNNRNLKTFDLDTNHTFHIHSLVMREASEDIVFVSESGIFGWSEVEPLIEAGVDAVLVGESLMRAASPETLLRELRGLEP
ncbi:MAG: indole-3-glycerol phosphate synthase TrpC [Nitrospinaceae bacterium]|jgi:indole-3-glycerol phosphate synthase|nr:indole-3-glycerol phosphate synthase TrpC [Nitrospinaceae bacterium]MBT3435430.1 indole-3-glycerol phosphate synthase TrpC [Nitrospinaceae bacterium]MBT4094602.1 indole-3-glycerol phosphate synthase TrpC [Nitrospinaceae bacterium]MBT4431911.1 indole-3-glycerol phosphate synthase TrpC [Nitrospinaceae bacterium]MBT5946580.1 indole-3-glycerol phosphate synthase TrpC [Nitrospinaceae bacterium]